MRITGNYALARDELGDEHINPHGPTPSPTDAMSFRPCPTCSGGITCSAPFCSVCHSGQCAIACRENSHSKRIDYDQLSRDWHCRFSTHRASYDAFNRKRSVVVLVWQLRLSKFELTLMEAVSNVSVRIARHLLINRSLS